MGEAGTNRCGHVAHPRMNERILPGAAWRFLICTLLLSCVAACGRKPLPERKPPEAAAKSETLVLPKEGAYTGAYIDFGEYEDDVTLEGIEGFEDLVGKHQAIVASSSYWGEQSFPVANVNLIWLHGSIPLIFWSPWDRPYEESNGTDRFALPSIIAGKWDDYIDRWADGVREFNHPLMVSFANEMNGSWFPWSGGLYGAGNLLPKTRPDEPNRYEGPETYKAAYRHVVDRVRARGVSNVLWVFHAMNYSYPSDSWNVLEQYYPGPDYVDWLGLSVYGQQFDDEPWVDFPPMADWPYKEICMLDSTKPVMMTEWGVGEFPSFGEKSEYIAEAFRTMPNYPRLKAAVFWHERWQNADKSYSNLRVNSSPSALKAYREGVQRAFWVDRPTFR